MRRDRLGYDVRKPEALTLRLVPETGAAHSVLSHAVKWDYLSDNALRRVDQPKTEQYAAAYLPVDAVKRLIQAAPREWRTLFLMAVVTGMRKGEILGLTWGAVDFEAKTLLVRHSLYKGVLGTPKSKSSLRQLPMTPQLLAWLVERKVEAPSSAMDLVFCKEDGSPLPPKRVTTALHNALKDAGLPAIRFHDLRHTVASTMMDNHENPKVVQEMLGHSDSSKTLMQVYAHTFPEHKVEAAGRLEAQFLGESLNGC